MDTPTIRILVLEDSPADAELVLRELQKLTLPHVVQWVSGSTAYAAALREAPPDLIVSDHNIAQFSGRAALDLAQELAPRAPFILVTGSLDDATAVEYMRAGAADYILKDRLVRLPIAVVAVLDQARARAALTAQERLLRQIIDANPSMIFVKDWDGRFVVVNRLVASVYGTTPDAIVGKTDADFNPNAAEVARFLRDDREVMTTGVRKIIPEEPVTGPSGETRWFQTIKVPLTLPGDPVPKLLGVSTDITDRRELEGQLAQSQKIEAVGRLAGGIAHDFNNLLTAIIGYADLLANEPGVRPETREDLDEVRRAAQRGAALTRQLLAFSRKQVLEPRVFDLNALVANLERMLHRLIGEDVELRTALFPELGAIRADPGQIEQVLVNLIINARDAMPHGGKVTIETANVELDETYVGQHVGSSPGPHVMLAVSDTGIGMDEATKARIFEPFFTTKGPAQGTGLGLSTAYGIVKQSGGNIWVYSEPGRGATFKVYLPRVEAPAERPGDAAPPVTPGGTETILLVEDADGVRNLARRLLVARGYTVLAASAGPEAEELARGHPGPIHLLLTDVVLPEIRGPELAKRLGAIRPGLRVLFMSGYPDSSIVQHGVLEPGVAYLQKPFTPDALARKVREVLGRA